MLAESTTTPRAVGSVLHRAQDRRRERVGDVVEQQPDRRGAGVGTAQSAGPDVGAEAEVVDGLPDPADERGRDPPSSLTTRETVLRLTPARAATSRIVGRLPSFLTSPPCVACRPRIAVAPEQTCKHR